ncbi:MAG: hypothetical protein ACRD3Q_10070 [Terriglobales bacterium]
MTPPPAVSPLDNSGDPTGRFRAELATVRRILGNVAVAAEHSAGGNFVVVASQRKLPTSTLRR